MQGPPRDFWGKVDTRCDAGGVTSWHPLCDHCADVAAVAEALLALPIWSHRLNRLAGSDLGTGGNARLCVLAALHDIGKLNIGFQARGRPDLGRYSAGHVTEALAALSHSDVFCCLDELGAWGAGVSDLLVAALCHHGRPYAIRSTAASWQQTWWKPARGLDPRAGARALLEQCRVWFPEAFSSACAPLPDSAALAHAFAGLVTLADWIASDTRFFDYAGECQGDRMVVARPAAHRALEAIGLRIEMGVRGDAAGRNAFARVSPHEARAAQDAVLELPLDEGSVTVLEAETGSGKTEAALARFVMLFEAGLVDGLYFALPTRTAATQMHRRVHEAVQRAFIAPPPVVLAVPGYLRVDGASGQRLPGFEVRWSDEERFRYRAWAGENAKRYLAGPIVVGTIDQVLLSSLMVAHSHLRATSLLRHLLVVDEVHASDAYMARILRDVLARHLSAGGHALLLSATLGGEARATLVNPGGRTTGPSLDEAIGTPYPCLTHHSTDQMTHPIRGDGREREIAVIAKPFLAEPGVLAAAAMDAALRGAKVLVIRNTVANCIATQIALEAAASAVGRLDLLFTCARVPAPHHSRFARPDREALDQALEGRFGRERAPGGCVVIATQTVQQSLDLDADILFSDLCPADVLLQRMGRLHRHERENRERPDDFREAYAIVAVPESRNLGALIGRDGKARNFHGLGSVYEDLRMLEATWRLIETVPRWPVPAMNRYLVEQSLHSAVLDAIATEGGSAWQQHATQMIGTRFGLQRQADLNLVDWSQPYAETSFPDAGAGRIATRLGEGDRRVEFEPTLLSPFQHEFSELVLPARWAFDVPGDRVTGERVTAEEGVIRFSFGLKAFVYDRLGLRVDEPTNTKKEVSDDDGP